MDQKVKKDPEIQTKLVNAKTIFPLSYEIKLNKKSVHIYDTPGFNITDSYEQEIASSLFFKKALESIKAPKLIPIFSFNELAYPATNFVKFLENLKRIVKGKKPSIYIVTNALSNDKNKIDATLARLFNELPEHSELILDIKYKYKIFPKSSYGKFNGENDLAIIRQKLSTLKPTMVDPELCISDGAKNKMRQFLDVWDEQLKINFDSLFDDILKGMVVKFASELDVDGIKDFKSPSKMEDLPDKITLIK